METNFNQLPENLPTLVDDGTTDHLPGLALPPLTLVATDGTRINLKTLAGHWVIYVYPMTGHPGVSLPDGWNEIPGARGCTPQSCAFRDHYQEFQALHIGVFGLSSQTSDYQLEVRDRLHLPFQLLSDHALQLKEVLQLPTFTVAGMELYKRLTLVCVDGRIVKVFYPVFPSDKNACEVLSWFQSNKR
jgi:peroxiredoxin